MADEIRRRKTADPEMDAMVVIAQVLEGLDSDTRARVLKWAEDRFLEQPKRGISNLAFASIKAQVDAYKKFAEELGVDDRTLAHAIAHTRSVKKLAPVEESDRDPEGTTKAAVERANG